MKSSSSREYINYFSNIVRKQKPLIDDPRARLAKCNFRVNMAANPLANERASAATGLARF